jgi:uncharacterized protein
MTAAKPAKGPRQKHIPQRTCIACRKVDPKRALFRLVRTENGGVVIDTTGKQAGRGAYLCHDPACWDLALRRGMLVRSLRLDALQEEQRAELEQFARILGNETRLT